MLAVGEVVVEAGTVLQTVLLIPLVQKVLKGFQYIHAGASGIAGVTPTGQYQDAPLPHTLHPGMHHTVVAITTMYMFPFEQTGNRHAV